MLSVPPPTRVAFGTLEVGGQKVELFVSAEWARYFQSLNTLVVANASVLAENAQQAALTGDGAEAPDLFPSPPGPRGEKGDPGPAIFLLQDDAVDQALLVPPSVDGVYVPLNTKDASGGVPGLTLFKLNLRNAANTITSWFTNAATVARTWTLPDKDGTVAMLSDFAAPPAIGNTTPATGNFTDLTTTGNTGLGLASQASARMIVLGMGATNATRSAAWLNGSGLDSMSIYDDRSVKCFSKWSCNGAAPQASAASGGTLAGVIAALVANGILSS